MSTTIDLMGGSQTVTGLDGVNLVVNGPGTFVDIGTANGVTLTDNGATIDIAGATNSATITDNGGNIAIGGVANSTTITATNGSIDIIGAATSASFDLNGSDLTIGGAANSTTFHYGTGISSVELGGAIGSTAFENLGAGDGVVLSGFTFDGGSFDAITNLLTLTEGGSQVTTPLSVTLADPSATFSFGGVDSFAVAAAPCFAAGTRIATPGGEVPVERLAIGDLVLTAAGDAKPIRWIGQRRLDCDRHPQPELVRPVRIRAGAIGEDRPRRDLVLSPDHALWLPGTGGDAANVLIPVKHLIDGATIVQENVARAHYFHVELATHDILLAEGLPAESYLDTGNRAQFENGAAQVSLHPDFAPLNWDDACAPLCVDGPALAAARRHLLARRIAASDLHVLVNDRMIRPVYFRGELHLFLLPAGTEEVRIVSRSGVRIGGIVADGKIIALDSPALAAGFAPPEGEGDELWRRTDGAARLVLPQASPRPFALELVVRDQMPSRIAPSEPADSVAA
jgi:hypothetical protein